MSNKKKKDKKKKRREEKLRKQKHAARFAPLAPLLPAFDDTFPRLGAGGFGALFEPRGLYAPPGAGDLLEVLDIEREMLARRHLKEVKGLSDADIGVWLENSEPDYYLLELEDKQLEAREYGIAALTCAGSPSSEKYAGQALAIDPNSLDALNVLASFKQGEERTSALQEIVAQGKSVLGENYFERHSALPWHELLDARPWLRAVMRLAESLCEAGRFEQAADLLKPIVDALPGFAAAAGLPLALGQAARGDFAGLRVAAASRTAARQNLDLSRIRDLDTVEADLSDATIDLLLMLERWIAGDRKTAARLYADADGKIPGLTSAVNGRDTSFFNNAKRLLELVNPIFSKHPELVEWCRQGARGFTPEEIQATLASYAPPVAALLALGKPSLSHEEAPDEYVKLGIGAQHFPELARMARDEALLEGDNNAFFGVTHAWFALGYFGGEPAAAELGSAYRLMHTRTEDWPYHVLPIAFSRVGPAALPEVEKLMRDKSLGKYHRSVGSETVTAIATRHPESRAQCAAALISVIRNFAHDDYTFNAAVICGLIELGVEEALPDIQRAFDDESVDESYCGDFESVEHDLRKSAAKLRQE